ncbi:hypothetical protein SOVF_179520 [Spinacia oleracea]|uniref:Tetrapyrrole biosynthesis uroporphyrinogen III synthase domain-containing protein n=1 Tax=Spinacia oleracea TaxID=3562 RepID=A0A9R0IMT9_SPIOL|nr:uncharacterized protein LOC110791499 [Spinacia oleracea]KNA06600.1 hypothetical protein SOVF_179520 [Spinacia oleracea]
MVMSLMTINSLLTPTASCPNPSSPNGPNRTVAFTTPEYNYASRLSLLLHQHNFIPLSCPTVIVGPTSSTKSSLLQQISLLHRFSAIAFTSRSGISAFFTALSESPSLPHSFFPAGEEFIIAALGKDAELLTPEIISKLSPNSNRVRIVLPSNPTPSGLVDSLGPGLGRQILCPVPLVLGLKEPPVVPDFLRDLSSMGWVTVRVNAYETRWAGPKCAEKLIEVDNLDGLVFTSTSEVEGLLKSLKEYGLDWDGMRRRWPGLIVAAHGPVTASGAEKLGVRVDVVSSKFSSFEGVVEVLDNNIWRNSNIY